MLDLVWILKCIEFQVSQTTCVWIRNTSSLGWAQLTFIFTRENTYIYFGRVQDGEELDIFYSWTTMEMNRNDHLRLLIFTIAINLAPVLFFISLPAFEGHDHGHRHHLPRDYELPNIIIISQSIFIKTSSIRGLICGTIILKPSDCSHFVAVVLVGNFESPGLDSARMKRIPISERVPHQFLHRMCLTNFLPNGSSLLPRLYDQTSAGTPHLGSTQPQYRTKRKRRNRAGSYRN